jgi:hypothetical protein
MKCACSILFIALAQLAFASSPRADDLGSRKAIEDAIRAERNQPGYTRLSEEERIARVISRVLRERHWQRHRVAAAGIQTETIERGAEPPLSKTKPIFPSLPPLPSEMVIVVRKDFANIGIVGLQDEASGSDKATGAKISVSNDRVAKNVSWTLQGVATVGYRTFFGDATAPNGPFYALAGAYAGIDKITNTAAKPDTPSKDNSIAGGLVELGTNSILGDDYFRFKAGAVTDHLAQRTLATIGKTTIMGTEPQTNLSISAEWIPVYNLSAFNQYIPGFHFPWHPFDLNGPFIRFDPELKFQYDSTSDSTKILAFSNKSRSLRLGPQFGVIIIPFAGNDWFADDSWFKPNLQNISITTYYHTYREFVSHHNFYNFQTNLNYKFNDNLGFSAGYTRGSDENTGKRVNVFTAGLTGQICWGGDCPKPKAASAGDGG